MSHINKCKPFDFGEVFPEEIYDIERMERQVVIANYYVDIIHLPNSKITVEGFEISFDNKGKFERISCNRNKAQWTAKEGWYFT